LQTDNTYVDGLCQQFDYTVSELQLRNFI